MNTIQILRNEGKIVATKSNHQTVRDIVDGVSVSLLAETLRDAVWDIHGVEVIDGEFRVRITSDDAIKYKVRGINDVVLATVRHDLGQSGNDLRWEVATALKEILHDN